jgi:Sin3 histone deacetylase corepressor complex component SDS3
LIFNRERAAEIDYTYNSQLITNDFTNEQRAALREFEEKKSELKEGLLMNLMKQRELIESERYGNELSLDSNDLKPASTRKLRRRPNDPVPVPEKNRRKAPQSQITFLLEDSDILQDLNASRGADGSPSKKCRQYLYSRFS